MSLPSNVALVELVIEYLQTHPTTLGDTPTGLPPEKLETLTFPDGKPLPPSLKRWLAFDARQVGLFEDLARPVALSTSLAEVNGYAYATMDRLLFPDKFYCLFGDDYDCSRFFLYTGQANAQQEYPVILTDTDDRYLATLFAPDFAVYLAVKYSVWDFNLYDHRANPAGYYSLLQHPELNEAMAWHCQHNFHGYSYLEVYGEAVDLAGKQTRWCSEADIILDLRKQGFAVDSLEEFFRE